MLRARLAAVAATLAVALVGCGASDEEQVARALEAYPHSLAAGDAQGACDAFSPRGRERTRRGDYCAHLRERVAEMTPEEQRRSGAAKGVRIEVEGDRATGYLQYGDCILIPSGAELSRDGSGDWRIDDIGGLVANHEQRLCLEE